MVNTGRFAVRRKCRHLGADGNDDTGRPRFIMGTVFDIARTDEAECAAAVAVC